MFEANETSVIYRLILLICTYRLWHIRDMKNSFANIMRQYDIDRYANEINTNDVHDQEKEEFFIFS